jgi:hypothetical protein
MGTRYQLTLQDMQKLVAVGHATIGKVKPLYKQEYNEQWDEMQDSTTVLFYVHTGSVLDWAFEAYSEDGVNHRLFSGCNWGKEDLDDLFETHGIEPSYG